MSHEGGSADRTPSDSSLAARVRDRSAAFDALKNYVIPSLSVLGLVLYGVLRLSYLYFYQQLRTSPEEVGYGYSEILVEALPGAIEVFVLLFLTLLVIAALANRLLGKLRKTNRELGDSAEFPRLRRFLGAPITGVHVFAAALLVEVLLLPIMSAWQGSRARSGLTVRNAYFIGVPYLPLLSAQAVPASVAWINPDAEEKLSLSELDCLMYLGSADGVAVFYDVGTRNSIRVPVGAIALSLHYTFSVDHSCRPTG